MFRVRIAQRCLAFVRTQFVSELLSAASRSRGSQSLLKLPPLSFRWTHSYLSNCKKKGSSSRFLSLYGTLFGVTVKDVLSMFGIEEEEEPPLSRMIRQGLFAFHMGDYDKSEQLLHIALKTAQDLNDQQAITYIYDVLANLAFQRQQFDKAQELYKAVLRRFVEDGGDPKDNSFVAVSLKVAECMSERGDYEDAIAGFQYCIKAQKEKIEKFDDVFKLVKTVPVLDEKLIHSQSSTFAFLKPITSLISSTLHPFDSKLSTPVVESHLEPEQEQGCDRNLQLGRDTLLLWAVGLEKYAHCLCKVGRYEQAVQAQVYALEVCRLVLGEQHYQTAVLRNDLGSAYALLRRFDDALEQIEQSIEIIRALIKKEDAMAEEEKYMRPKHKIAAIPVQHKEDLQACLATYFVNLGSVQLLRGKLNRSKQSCLQGLAYAQEHRCTEAITEAKACLQAVAQAAQERSENRRVMIAGGAVSST